MGSKSGALCIILLLARILKTQDYPAWPGEFAWSHVGIPGDSWECVAFNEQADPHTWGDNYLCWVKWRTNPKFVFSSRDPVKNMKCWKIYEDMEASIWNDNYLCAPKDTPYEFYYSGSSFSEFQRVDGLYYRPGWSCKYLTENSDPNSWFDNALCGKNYRTPAMESNLLPAWPDDFLWSYHGSLGPDWECVKIDNPGQKDVWSNNHLCYRSGGAPLNLTWSTSGAIPGMKCTRVDTTIWTKRSCFLCITNEAQYTFNFLIKYLNLKSDFACIEFNEPEAGFFDGSNNNLCAQRVGRATMPYDYPSWPGEFIFSHRNTPGDAYSCISMNEPKDSHSWADNYLCWLKYRKTPGFVWSDKGPIVGMQCLQVMEVVDPDSWNNNYLCAPKDTPYEFFYTSDSFNQFRRSDGQYYKRGWSCLFLNEVDDPNSWLDNSICAKNYKTPELTKLVMPAWPEDFAWSYYGNLGPEWECVQISHPSDGTMWKDNYLCYRSGGVKIGLTWSIDGPVPRKRCVSVSLSDKRWPNGNLCVGQFTPYNFSWVKNSRSKDISTGCVEMTEPLDRPDGIYNHLCGPRVQRKESLHLMDYPRWPADFAWSPEGAFEDMNCIKINDPDEDQRYWSDNYFCWTKTKADPEFEWSTTGPVHHKNCVRVVAAGDKKHFKNTFICYSDTAPYNFSWRTSFPESIAAGQFCLQFYEPGSDERWSSNYLCGVIG